MAVEDHRRNEDLVTEDLLAAARDEGLRSLMRRMRSTDQRHLEEARRLLGTSSAGR